MKLSVNGVLRKDATVTARANPLGRPNDAISEAIELLNSYNLKSITVIFRDGNEEFTVIPGDNFDSVRKKYDIYLDQHGLSI